VLTFKKPFQNPDSAARAANTFRHRSGSCLLSARFVFPSFWLSRCGGSEAIRRTILQTAASLDVLPPEKARSRP